MANIALDMANTVGERLRQAREEAGKSRGRKLTQRELAKTLGIDEERYRSYEYDRASLPTEIADQLSRLLRKAASWFYTDGELGNPLVPVAQLLVPIAYIGSVSAGSKADWNDPFESEEMIEVPPEMVARGRFAATVLGDSCFDLLFPGDTVIFQKEQFPRIGLMVLHRSPDRTVTVKQLKHDGRQYMLHALNPSYEDEAASGQLVGYLVGIVRQLGSRRMTVYDAHGISP